MMLNAILIILLWNSVVGRKRCQNNLFCGIVGFSGPKDRNLNIDKIKLLLFYNQERGKDSLGFYTPKEGIYKEIGKPEDQMAKASFSIPESNLFIGHLRAATVGEVNKNNAHPFEYGNIVLLMNGTLTNHWALARQYELVQKDYDVDTQVVASIINKTQSKDVLGKVIGGCAILYVDTKTEKMYAFTNGQRPLFRGTLNGCMYISSIENSLKMIGCLDVKTFKDNYFYEIQGGRILSQSLIKIDKELTQGGTVMYDHIHKYAYVALQMFQMKNEELERLWLSPDYDEPIYHLRQGFSYKCVPSDKSAMDHQLTVINDKGEKVVVSKSKFMYKAPVISAGSSAFATSKLTFKNETKGEKTVFCELGDLLIAKERISATEWYCLNLSNQQSATVSLKYLRFAMRKEIDNYFEVNWLGESEEISKHNPNQIKLPLEGVDKTEHKDEMSSYLDRYKKELESTELSEDFEAHSAFCMDTIEDMIADLDEIKTLDKVVLEKIGCIKITIDYYTKHLGAYFDMSNESDDDDDDNEDATITPV